MGTGLAWLQAQALLQQGFDAGCPGQRPACGVPPVVGVQVELGFGGQQGDFGAAGVAPGQGQQARGIGFFVDAPGARVAQRERR